ncbi:MAG: hypothetical protein V1718_04280 [archaeon]
MKTRTTHTLFEYESIFYSQLGWADDDTRINQLEKLNTDCGETLLHLGRHKLTATQFVGLIRIGNISLQILPKIDFIPDSQEEQKVSEREVTAASNLMTMLAYAYNLCIHPQDAELMKKSRGDWFEWLSFLFSSELNRQLRLGMDRTYIEKEEALPMLRGKWLLARQYARSPIVIDRFEVRYADYSAYTILNRVFYAAVTRLLRITRDQTNYRLLLSAYSYLAELDANVEPPSGYQELVHFTRLNERFKTAYQLADLFLESSIFHFSVGRQDVTAFVFDMNRLFEEYVAAFLIKHKHEIFGDQAEQMTVISQAVGRYDYFLKQTIPGNRDVFRLKPDILIRRSGQLACIADTKYKMLEPRKRDLGLQEEDSYQMLAYSIVLECDRIILLYPQPESIPFRAEYEVNRHNALLGLAGINLHQPLDKPANMIKDMQRIFGFLVKEENYAKV